MLAGRIVANSVVLVPGVASTIDLERLRMAADQSATLRAALVRHGLAVYTQIQQTAGCNASHPVESRLARCLLQTHDLACGCKHVLIQESMAQMIGARRNSVSLVASTLQQANFIHYSRGHIEIVNREGLTKTACECYNELGALAKDMGFRAGLHNHMGQIVQNSDEVDRCMALTDPKLFYFSPDTAHVYLGGGDPAVIMEKYKHRLMMADYKDAKRAGLTAKYAIHACGERDSCFRELCVPLCKQRVLTRSPSRTSQNSRPSIAPLFTITTLINMRCSKPWSLAVSICCSTNAISAMTGPARLQ